MATIRQIASELGIPKHRVAKWVRDHFDTATLTTLKTRGSSNTYDLSDDQVMEVKQHFIEVYSSSHEPPSIERTSSGTGSESVKEPDTASLLIEALNDQIDDLKAERREMRLQMDTLTEMLKERSEEVKARDAEIRELRARLDLPWWKKLLGK